MPIEAADTPPHLSTSRKEPDMPTKRAAKPKTVRVSFTLPAIDADEVALCAEFNDWSHDTKLTRNGDGSWQTSVRLTPGVYRYRYLLDGSRWENAWDADDYVPNPYGGDDSLVFVGGALPGETTRPVDASWMASSRCWLGPQRPCCPISGWTSPRPEGVCAACPVGQTCLDYPLANRIEHGVWAATSSRERPPINRHRRAAPAADIRRRDWEGSESACPAKRSELVVLLATTAGPCPPPTVSSIPS
jgi:Transcription factor WhiB/Glycogen recognition site of AMP-activated protein kinase